MAHRRVIAVFSLAVLGLLASSNRASTAEGQVSCEACVRRAVQEAISDIQSRGWLGVALHYHRAPDGTIVKGAEVMSIDPKSPARRSPLKTGDVLLRWNDTRLEEHVKDEIQDLTRALRPGGRVHLVVQRGAERLEVDLVAEPMPTDAVLKTLGAQLLIDYGAPSQPRRPAG